MPFFRKNYIAKRFLPALLVMFLFHIVIYPQREKADLAIVNAIVRTIDKTKPRAQAVAIKGNKIMAVGSDAEIRPLIDARTKIIDAHERLVLPGFNDSHVHFLGIGNNFFSIDLRAAKTPQDVVEKIKYYVRFLPKGQWILGGAWNQENWTPSDLPTKELIDAVTPDHPVFIYHAHPNMVLVNSLALKMAGLDKERKEVPGGEIVRNARGEPTGILKGAALLLVKKLTPLAATADKPAVAEAATNYAASLGVTSVQDMQQDDNIEVYRELDRQGKLKTRIYDCFPLPDWKKLADAGIKRASGTEMLRTGCLKGFYDDNPELLTRLYENILAADKADLQVMLHAIGGSNNDVVLSVLERVFKITGDKDRRFRVEHAHNVRPKDLARFHNSKIIASMQPFLFFGGVLNDTEPYRTLLNMNTTLAFGSDSSIGALNPLLGIYAAVTGGRDLAGRKSFGQTLSVEEAVRAYTLTAAYAEFQENVKGSITVGKLADLVVLSDDIFTINPGRIKNTKVLYTIVDGRIVYEQSKKD